MLGPLAQATVCCLKWVLGTALGSSAVSAGSEPSLQLPLFVFLDFSSAELASYLVQHPSSQGWLVLMVTLWL